MALLICFNNITFKFSVFLFLYLNCYKLKIDIGTDTFYLLIKEFLRYSYFNMLLLYAAPAVGMLKIVIVNASYSTSYMLCCCSILVSLKRTLKYLEKNKNISTLSFLFVATFLCRSFMRIRKVYVSFMCSFVGLCLNFYL